MLKLQTIVILLPKTDQYEDSFIWIERMAVAVWPRHLSYRTAKHSKTESTDINSIRPCVQKSNDPLATRTPMRFTNIRQQDTGARESRLSSVAAISASDARKRRALPGILSARLYLRLGHYTRDIISNDLVIYEREFLTRKHAEGKKERAFICGWRSWH